ncbi:MAG: IPT/TIG domain-containing protein [Planctomycetes bacterium]|nr:IPT/TIG domain-containing protein [Planctomycetota bacterium]
MIELTEGIAGDRLNLYGRNFPAGRNANVTVTIAGTPATVQTVGTNVITVTGTSGRDHGDVRISILGGPQNLGAGRHDDPARCGAHPTSVDMADRANSSPSPPPSSATPTRPSSGRSTTSSAATARFCVDHACRPYTAPAIGTGQQFPFVIGACSAAFSA